MIKVTELYIYPVKSMAGIRVQSSELATTGFKYDRHWMVVDKNGKFVSQREAPAMVLIQTQVEQGQLILSHENSSIRIPDASESMGQLEVSVWRDTVWASHICKRVDDWISSVLDKECRLVCIKNDTNRQIDIDYANKGQFVSFADGFPFLLISQASLDDLSSRLADDIEMKRFRPNIVVSGCEPFDEDSWGEFSIGDFEFKAVKKCSRCIIPSINPDTAEKDGVKIIAELNRYRKQNRNIFFGQNIIYKNSNLHSQHFISCGDEIKFK